MKLNFGEVSGEHQYLQKSAGEGMAFFRYRFF